MYQTDPPRPAKETMPTMYDLPSEEIDQVDPNPPLPVKETMPTMYDLPSELVGQPGLPDELHLFQPKLLGETCQSPNYPATEMLLASDLNLYYDSRNTRLYKRPDWFMVVGVPRGEQQQDLRLSYVVWQEGVSPFLVVELLSPGTEAEDLGQTLREADKPPTKWEVIVYDRYENNLRVFRLVGSCYEAMALPQGRVWLEELQLGLGLWEGSYQGIRGLWLRLYDSAGWVPTPSERAEAERDRANRMAEYLRSVGIDPDNLPPNSIT